MGGDFEGITSEDETLGAVGKLDLEAVRILAVKHSGSWLKAMRARPGHCYRERWVLCLNQPRDLTDHGDVSLRRQKMEVSPETIIRTVKR